MKISDMDDSKQNLIIFKNETGDISIHVRLDNDTVWLTLAQIAELFDVQKPAIHKHLQNIYKTNELSRESTVSNLEIVQTEGKRNVKRNLELYNLDAIIAIGYRVNSIRATQFRQWASNVLKEHLIKGYSFHQQRIYEKGIDDLQKAMDLLSQTLQKNALTNDIGQHAIEIISHYAKTWNLLLAYDEDSLSFPSNLTESSQIIEYESLLPAIYALKNNLIKKGEATPLFGQQCDEQLQAIFAAIQQTFGGTFLYPSCIERAAHLIYFVIKDHPFVDGNKRIGSFLFLIYLQSQDPSIVKISDSTLVALALLIAESDPKDKDLLIKLTMNLIIKD